MQISKKINDAINEQINAELESAYVYLSMAAYFDGQNLKGFAGWMKKQFQEEISHAMKFYNYVYERQGSVVLTALSTPQSSWKSPLAAFQTAYAHETKITGLIHALYDLSQKEKDTATASMLKWFIDEQVEEEGNTDEVVQMLKMAGDNVSALMFLDSKLGSRQ